MRLNILGTMGIGKTTLGRAIANELGVDFHPEPFEANPYLEAAYLNGKLSNAAELTQVAFLPLFLEHSKKRGVLDSGLMPSVYAYAPIYLMDEAYDRFYGLYQHIADSYRQPDLYICLQAPTEVIYDRIKARGRDMEKSVSKGWLGRLNGNMNLLYASLDRAVIIDWSEFRSASEVIDEVDRYIQAHPHNFPSLVA